MEATKKILCTVQILTLNSGKTLKKCLESVKDFDDILILDGNSTDSTLQIARSYGARVFPQSGDETLNAKIKNFSEVRNRGLALAKYPWVLVIDSDEYVSKELPGEIRQIIERGKGNAHFIFRLPRKFVYQGEIIERSLSYPNYQHRFFYTPATLGFFKPVHESIKPKPGEMLGTLLFPEYVPLDPIDIMRSKTSHYLDIQQQTLKNLSFRRFYRGLWGNALKATKLLVKYGLLVFKKGKRMPFVYEYETTAYHIRLLGRLTENYVKKILSS